MARRHNVKKERSRSNYHKRLRDRGLAKAPRMKSLSELRNRLSKEERQIIEDRENSEIRKGR